jgi:hypothetical protein
MSHRLCLLSVTCNYISELIILIILKSSARQRRGYIYDKRQSDYAKQDKTDLAWERISHEMKESGSRLKLFRNNISASI